METQQINTTNPLVSVIIPAYNAERFIQKTLESVVNQTYHNIEVLVVDDGSQDKTAEIVKSIAQQDSRVILLQQENTGVAAARNLAISKSRGEYIAPIDADDIWFPQNLEKQVQCMIESNINVGVVYSWSVDIDEEGLLTGGFYNSKIEGNVYKALIYKYFLGNASACLIRRICFDKVGGYNCQLKLQNAQGCEDWDMHLRIAEYYQYKVIPEYLIGYRQIFSSMSCNYASMANSHILVMTNVREKHPDISRKIFQWSSSSFYMYLSAKSSRNGDYKTSLFWLYQALLLDFIMIIMHHNMYILLLINTGNLMLKKIKFISRLHDADRPQIKPGEKSSMKSKNMTISDVIKTTKIHRMLPATIYEKMRSQTICM